MMRSLRDHENGNTYNTDRKVESMWDESMSEENRVEWKNFFINLLEVEDIRFPRCIKPVNAIGQPILTVFSDGSNYAYGTCAYIR